MTLSVIDLAGRQAIYCAWRDLGPQACGGCPAPLCQGFREQRRAILITDRNNRIIAVNQAQARQWLSPGRIARLGSARPFPHKTPRETYQLMWAALHESGYWQGELWDLRKDGMIYPKWAAISAGSTMPRAN